MNFSVCGDRILVRPPEPQTKTDSGLLFTPEKYHDNNRVGEVLGVGPRCPISVKVGDKVLYESGYDESVSNFGSNEFDFGGKCVVLGYQRVLAVVES